MSGGKKGCNLSIKIGHMINNNKYFRRHKDYYPIFYEIITEELNSKTDNIVEP